MPCPTCGSPLIREGNLFKCPICGLLYLPKQNKPLLKNYAKLTIQTQPAKTEEELTSDQIIFINRVAQALAPTIGLTGEAYKRCRKIQEQYREELRQVFQGKKDFNEWFNQKRTERGLHLYTFTKMIHDCLDGLDSPEARSLREQYAETIARLGNVG